MSLRRRYQEFVYSLEGYEYDFLLTIAALFGLGVGVLLARWTGVWR